MSWISVFKFLYGNMIQNKDGKNNFFALFCDFGLNYLQDKNFV